MNSDLRRRAYRQELLKAVASGVSKEGIRDCLRAFENENPSLEDLRAALRDYRPSPSEAAKRREKERAA